MINTKGRHIFNEEGKGVTKSISTFMQGFGPGGVLDLRLGRGCRTDLETLTLFMIKSS